MTTGNGEAPHFDLSIVTVSHNHLPQIQTCLGSLYSISWDSTFEMVVVDNACRDGTAQWVAANYPRIRAIRNAAPQGFAANVNMAMRTQQKGRYVLLMNPDVECLPGLLDTLVVFMDEHPDVGIAGAKLLNPDGSLQPSCRRFSTPGSVLVRGLHLDGVFRSTGLMRRYLMDDYNHETVADVDWVTGALMIVRREAVALVGVMDERYFLYSEDQDWCCRMWQAGWRVCYVPQARAVHAHTREGIRRPWSRAARHQVVSAVRMFSKFGWRLSRRAPTAAVQVERPANTPRSPSDADEPDRAHASVDRTTRP